MAQYISKSALVAQIRKRLLPVIRDKHYDEWEEGQNSERMAILSLIDTLEVKEVDLEKEIDKWWWGKTWRSYGMMLNPQNVRDFAKHFFELGIKAQKGE